MKKSLVITTIATVLVIVVALTTATFAWFSTSATTQTTSDFTVSSTSAAITISRWKPGTGAANGAYEGPLTSAWILGNSSAADYEYAYTDGGAVKGEGATPSTSYALLAPTEEISATKYDNATDNKRGLPSVPFATATSDGGTVTIGGTTLHPVAVRFRLSASQYKATKVVASIKISVPGSGATSQDYEAANAARVVLMGVNGDASVEHQDFTIATNYNYITSTSSYATALKEFTAAGDTAVNSGKEVVGEETLTINGTETAIVGVVNPELITQYGDTSTSAASTIAFKAEAGVFYDCVLYIWIDGVVADDNAALGRFTVAVNFSGIEIK